MTDTGGSSAPSRGFWIISIVALLWNLVGVATYLMSVTMSPEALAALPEPERALHEHVPAWVTSAYAIGVFGGTLGSLALLLRRGWAVPLFVASLAGIVAQMGHAFFGTAMIAVLGAGSAILPLVITAIGVALIVFARGAKAKGWIG